MSDLRALVRALAAHAHKAEEDAVKALERIATARAERGTPDEAALLALASALGRATASAALAARLSVRWPQLTATAPKTFATEVHTAVPNVAFAEAIRDLEQRDPVGAAELARMGLDVETVYGFVETSDGSWVSPHGFALARAADALTASKVRDEIVTGLREGTTNEKTATRLASDWDWPAAYARTVVRTNVATAESAGRYREAHRVQEQTGARVGFRVETAGDSDVRRGRAKDNGENHQAMDGFIARVDDPVWRTHTPPYSWNCFTPGTRVQGCVLFASRMAYSGEVVEILTQQGRRLTLTPNHPVLTERGFAAAGVLDVGENLLCHSGQDDGLSFWSSKEVHEQHEPAAIEEVFRALAERGHVTRLDRRANDFHGDAERGDGEIEVVAVNRELALELHAQHLKRIREPLLVAVPRQAGPDLSQVSRPSAFGDFLIRVDAPGCGGPGASALARNDFLKVGSRAAPRPLQGLGRGAPADLCAAGFQTPSDDVPRDAERVGDGFLGLSGGVTSNYGSVVNGEPGTVVAEGDASSAEHAINGPGRDALLVRQLLARGPSQVALDEVVSVRRLPFAGHVYDLQTVTGLVISQNIYVSNCRCLAVPVFGLAVPLGFVAAPSAARFAPGFGGRADKAYSGG